MTEEFWQLAEEYQIPCWELSKICNAPIKVLLAWTVEEVPDWALENLKKHLGIESPDDSMQAGSDR